MNQTGRRLLLYDRTRKTKRKILSYVVHEHTQIFDLTKRSKYFTMPYYYYELVLSLGNEEKIQLQMMDGY